MNQRNPLSGLYRLTRTQRLEQLNKHGHISAQQQQFLIDTTHPTIASYTDIQIENTIGTFALPLGVATHIVIDHRPVLVPMAVEETSIVAALSHAGKWSQTYGSVTTEQTRRAILGHIHIAKLHHPSLFVEIIHARKDHWIQTVNHTLVPSMVARGGGLLDMHAKILPHPAQSDPIGVVELRFDPCDSMGANCITQIGEQLKQWIKKETGEHPSMAIVSNHDCGYLTTATLTLTGVNPILADQICQASAFAEADPKRAVTHNKGITNAIDAVLIATGNDWRANAASLHAYASQSGTYRPLSTWKIVDQTLIGTLTAPVQAATVGGACQGPSAQCCLEILQITDANHLCRILAGIGLLQNLAAIKSLVTTGLSHGHMSLHLNNLIAMSDATESEREQIRLTLQTILTQGQKVGMTQVQQHLERLRQGFFDP